jgi:hypothetical protein
MNRFNRLEVEGAVADFTKAVAHYGKDPNYFFRRGQARLVNEELGTAVGDFDRAAALNRGNEFLATLIYVHRGYALLLQGKEGEARKEFEKCKGLKSGTQVQFQFYLLGIDAQIKERRRRRADSLKGIT